MVYAEIIIAVLLAIIVIVSSIYTTLFLYKKYQKKKEIISEDGEYEEEGKSKTSLVISILLYAYLALSIFVFTTNIVYRVNPLLNNEYYISVNSNSMSAPLSSNNYLVNNNLTNQIQQYDIAVFKKYENQEIKKYDILLFKRNNKLIVHRVVEIIDENSYYVQGDFNPSRDEDPVNKSDVIGIYKNKLHFMSFVNYIGYTPGFYVAFVGVTYLLGVSILFEIKNNKLLKK